MTSVRVARARLDMFEIPAIDFERADRFYGIILDAKLRVIEVDPSYPMAMLLAPELGSGSVLAQGEGHTPSTEGSSLWLIRGRDLVEGRDRVGAVDGRAQTPKTSLGAHGFCRFLQDTGGNPVGLHSIA
jgi:predicted enzyme related to lactoylglutathione lyase